ncbi:MAG: circularly permuted type 2 ATP-grasp protein [Verrucomicrobiota bacterium]
MSVSADQLNLPVVSGDFPPEVLGERAESLKRIAAEIGHHFSLTSDQGDHAGWDLDVFPQLLPSEDWDLIQKGSLQRMEAFSRFVSDVYGKREIVREGILPAELLLGMPGYYRELLGEGGPTNSGFLLGAMDLVQERAGKWVVYENHFSFPSGISHVIQNRRMLAQAFPEIFSGFSVVPVAGFGSDLIEALKGTRANDVQRIVLLTRGDTVRPHFDDSFLARHMGIIAARPVDLLVRDGRAFVKTIDGLERVDVILRKVETNAVDPITFVENSDRGVPGLVHCIREGNVRIENVLGAEVADDLSLLPFSDAIVRFYLGEVPLLPTVETFHCVDQDQAEWVKSRPEEFRFDRVATPRVMETAYASNQTGTFHVNGNIGYAGPFEWTVARRKLSSVALPRWTDSGIVQTPYFLRVFGMLRPHPVILPGGLSWEAGVDQALHLIGGMKDTWVIDPRVERFPSDDSKLETQIAPTNLSAPSRVAEGLYWLARYLERARNSAHQASLLESIRLTELAPEDMDYYWPLWRGVASAADFSPIADLESSPENFKRLFRNFVAKKSEPSSVTSSLFSARRNVDRIQEWITPEMSESFYHMLDKFEEEMGRRSKAAHRRNLDACLIVSQEHARFVGTLERTLSHDSVYEFWLLGVSLERAICTITLLEAIIPSRVTRQQQHLEDDTDLTALLRLLGCLDAYRREYRSRAYLDRVIRLIWRNRYLPGSILFNLVQIRESMKKLEDETPSHTNRSLRRKVNRVIKRVDDFPIEEVFPARADLLDFASAPEATHVRTLKSLRVEFRWMRKSLLSLHSHIEDLYFSHQLGRMSGNP